MPFLRDLSATLLLVAAMTVGLGGGFAAPARFDASLILWPSIFAQTIVAVGGLAPTWLSQRDKRVSAMKLLAIHHGAATVPYLAIWLLLPSGIKMSPLAVGLVSLAIVPTAAGLPAYAAAARVSPGAITAFALLAYVTGLVVTPLLALVVFGEGADIAWLLVSIGIGLVAPALLGVILGRWVRRIPVPVRSGIVAIGMAITTYALASAMRETLSAGGIGVGLVLAAVTAGALRVPISALIGTLLAPRRRGLRAAAAVAAGYKNDALAASIALQFAGPVGVLPALGSLLSEMVFIVGAAVVARSSARRRKGAVTGTKSGTEPDG